MWKAQQVLQLSFFVFFSCRKYHSGVIYNAQSVELTFEGILGPWHILLF